MKTVNKKLRAIGRRLRRIRRDQRLSRRQMAARYRLDREVLRRYETGKSVPDASFLTVLFLEGYDISWLLSGKGEMSEFKRPARDHDFNLFRLWVMVMAENYSGYREWFRIELEKRFPEFKKWRRRPLGNSDNPPRTS